MEVRKQLPRSVTFPRVLGCAVASLLALLRDMRVPQGEVHSVLHVITEAQAVAVSSSSSAGGDYDYWARAHGALAPTLLSPSHPRHTCCRYCCTWTVPFYALPPLGTALLAASCPSPS
jgi:hypothetical protein